MPSDRSDPSWRVSTNRALRRRCSRRPSRSASTHSCGWSRTPGSRGLPITRGAARLRIWRRNCATSSCGARERTLGRSSRMRRARGNKLPTRWRPTSRRRAGTPARPTSHASSRRSGTRPTSARSFLPCRSPLDPDVAARNDTDSSRSRYVASLIPGAELREMPGDGVWSEDDMVASAEELRRFAGVERAPRRARHDPVDRAVHRHRRLDREAGVARRPRLEGTRRAAPRDRARRARPLARRRERHRRRRLLRDVRRPGAGDPLRPGDRRARPRSRHRDPRRRAHRRVRADRRQDRRHRRLDRRPRGLERRSLRGARSPRP